MHCMNPYCTNQSHQGRFVGRACYPCYQLAVDISGRKPKPNWCKPQTFNHITDHLLEFLNQNHSGAVCVSCMDDAIFHTDNISAHDLPLVIEKLEELTKRIKGE